MEIVVKRSEERLIADLQEQQHSFPSNRCLHIRLSQMEMNRDEVLSNLLVALEGVVTFYQTTIYICHDNDLFLLNRSLSRKTVEKLFNVFCPSLSPVQQTQFAGLASLFEVGIEWQKMRAILEKKIEKRDAKHIDTKTREALSVASHEETIEEISAELIRSLSERRSNRKSPEVMVVEDDPFSQKLVSNALREQYAFAMTGDGQGAILNYVRKAPDILFLDIGLPDIDGHQVLAEIFKIDPNAYVVMFSGNGDKENIMRAVELGAKGFVGKPFTKSKLFQYIEKSPFVQAKKKEKGHGDTVH